MLERICPKCNVPMMGERCVKPSCGYKTISTTTLYWCNECNIPIYEKICPVCGMRGEYIATDIRPVFPEERLLIALILDEKDVCKYINTSMWCANTTYIVDGKKLKISISKINRWNIEKIRDIKEKYEELVQNIDYSYFDENVKRFVLANQEHYNFITEEATVYIQSFSDRYAIEDMFVSFSGGKDSTVTSHLVNKALGTNKVLHIFGDTTLEFPLTYEYKQRFNRNEESKGVRVISAKNREKNFEELCQIIGPPSRVMRWCCTVFKNLFSIFLTVNE